MVPREIKIVDPESTRRVVPRAWGGDGELVFKGDRASVWEGEDVLEEGGGGGCSYYVHYEGVCICVTVFLCVCVCETHVCMCVCVRPMCMCVCVCA